MKLTILPAVSAKITVQRKLAQVLSSTRANQLCHKTFALDMRLAYELKSVLKAIRRGHTESQRK